MKFTLPLLGMIALLASCSGKADLSTPEKFADAVIKSINAKDTTQFRSLYVNSDNYDEFAGKMGWSNNMAMNQDKTMALNAIAQMAAENYAAITGEIIGIGTFQLNPFEISGTTENESLENVVLEIETPDHHRKKIVLNELYHFKDGWKATGAITIEEVY